MWVEEEGLVLSYVATQIEPRSGPRTVEDARRPRLVCAARRASGEEWALRSFDCRHQDSRGSSGEDKLTPRGVRPRTPSSGSERFRSRVEAHAVGRGMAPFCRRRTIPGCPDAYRQCYAKYSPRLMRCAPPRRTEACARRPPSTTRSSGLDLRCDIVKTRPSSSTHTPATSHTTQTAHSADRTRSSSG